MVFAKNAIQESKNLITRYENEQSLSQSDRFIKHFSSYRDKFDLLQKQYPKMETIIAFDIMSLVVVGLQCVLMVCQKYRLKKSL